MNVNLELIFFYAIIISAGITCFDLLFLASKRKRAQANLPLIIDYARSFLPILLIAFSVRSFGYEPRRIPSGSLEPTLLIGDFILVNKFAYGIRLPILHTKILSYNEPKRGDIVVFRSPTQPSMDLIKRVVGVPGDQISYINKIIYINGQEIDQQFEKFTTDQDANLNSWQVAQKQENLLGVKHRIYQIPHKGNDDFFNVLVPAGNYFMIGDNRDDSADSRYWGFMPEANIIGKATRVLMSFDKMKHPIRWERMGAPIV